MPGTKAECMRDVVVYIVVLWDSSS